MIEIRTVELKEDTETFWNWFEIMVDMSIENSYYEKELSLMLMLRMSFQDKIYAVFKNHKMIAYALVDSGDDNTMIAFMLVDCAFRRKGIGKKMLDVIIERNLDNALYTETNDRTALAFYSQYNFKLDKTITCKGDKYFTLKLQR